MPDMMLMQALWSLVRARLDRARFDERGSPTVETVLITAGLAALAIAVVAIIVVKVTGMANNIPTQ